MVISIFISPEHVARMPVERPGPVAPRLTERQRRLVQVLSQSERRMATVWAVVNEATRQLAPGSRTEARTLRVDLLNEVNDLLRRGLVRRHGRDFLALAEDAGPGTNCQPRSRAHGRQYAGLALER